MKRTKKLLSLVLALALVISVLAIPSVDAQAATKTTTYTFDAKTGILNQTAFRCYVQNPYTYDNSTQLYLANDGDYISSVKSSSKNLICKKTQKYQIISKNSHTSGPYEAGLDDEQNRFKSFYYVTVYAKKPGTYTLTVKINDKNNKAVATKKIKVYAAYDANPIKEIKYAGKTYYGTELNTVKASGKLSIKMNKDFSIKKLEVGTADGTDLNYKTFKNGSKLSLAKSTIYKDVSYSSGDPKDMKSYYYESGSKSDFLKPATYIRVTYYDKLLKITKEISVDIINIK